MSFPHTVRRARRPGAAAALLVAALISASPASAQPAARGAAYDLPAQPLGEALLALGRQAGLEISFLKGREINPGEQLR
ncbi:hypothetical protein LMG26858_00895 [Achromobacter anxifer]|uniref:Secretin/TonB short N-terminal domain-containing protein n=1 Tax=Achromobacter anxifer TaxID=1287737 RepID=A0A6S7CFM4_9BURK|nr:hypothetical protein [Achromobacter anxifer]CAB3835094.1 hypothetical protein LMG26858_00895 [Achromobacter anxifer]